MMAKYWSNLMLFIGFNLLVVIQYGKCADPVISRIEPHYGSLNGQTRIIITGVGFARDPFNFGAGKEHLGNKVKLVSATLSFDCEINQNDCHERQLGCYTKPMPADTYYVRVLVDSVEVPVRQHCRWETDPLCRFHTTWWSTPELSQIEPSSGPPGTILKIHGKIITTRVFSTQGASSNGRTERIRRVYVGHLSCEIIEDVNTDKLYGIALYNIRNTDIKSDYGWFKCKLLGNYVGNMNVSFIIEGQFGRSQPSLDIIHVSPGHPQKLHMFQTYAVINEVSPVVGGVEGGTELHIRGNYFDETKSKARVYVGGEPCDVIKPVTETEIVCKTPSKPTTKAYYSGNRGVWVDLWFKGYVAFNDLTQIPNYNTFDPDYNRTWYDGAGYNEHSDNQATQSLYSIRTQGYFLPPQDGDYRFYLLADDTGLAYFSETENPTDKVKILECPKVCSKYFVYNTQQSKIFSLKANKKYYFETLSSEGHGNGYVRLGVKMFKTNFVNTQSSDVINEQHKLQIRSTVVHAKQVIKLLNLTRQSSVKEVQSVVLEATNLNIGDFKLGMAGAWTEIMSLDTDAKKVKSALENLPTMHPNTVTVTKSAGPTFTVTFPGDLGDLPLLNSQVLPPHVANVTVTETTKGVSSLDKFQLQMGGVPSPQISTQASHEEVRSAIMTMFTVRCPTSVDGSTQDISSLRKHHFTFDEPSEIPHSSWGRLAKGVEPFCGNGSLQQPKYLFRNNGGYSNVSLYTYKMMCFAYKGNFKPEFYLRYNYRKQDLTTKINTNKFKYAFINDNRWHYTCLDLFALVTSIVSLSDGSRHMMEYLMVFPVDSETFVDEVEISKIVTVPEARWPGIPQERLLPPMGVLLRDVLIKNETVSNQYEVTLVTYNCAHDFPLFSVVGSQVTDGSMSAGSQMVVYGNNDWMNNATIQVDRIDTATAPVMGTFNITYYGESIEVAADIRASELQDHLRTIPGMGHVEVSRGDTCSGYSWTITWKDIGGHQPLPTIISNGLVGNNVSMETKATAEGGILFKMIPGAMLRTLEFTPQVVVYINDIPSACVGNCSYEWQEQSTPIITSVSPSSGSSSANTVLTITGTNLDPETGAQDNTTVIIGGAECHVTSESSIQILCDIGSGPLGTYPVDVKIAGKGSSRHDSSVKEFTYNGEITSISPTQGSYGGGIMLNITGSGFSNESSVTVSGQDCPIVNYTYTIITCKVPAKLTSKPQAAPVVVTNTNGNLNSPTDFTYSLSLSPVVESISLTNSLVPGGEHLLITGSRLQPADNSSIQVMLGSAKAMILSHNDSDIVAVLPPNPPGSYPLVIDEGPIGAADLLTNNIPSIEYRLSVDAVYPTEGSLSGGTRITIQGSGYPTNSSLVNVTIGDAKCEVESVTANQIVCMAGEPFKVHTVTNMGKHPKYGTGYAWLPSVLSIYTGDTVRWQWTVPDRVQHRGYQVYQVANVSDTEYLSGGFKSGAKAPKGSLSHQFDVEGIYYYTSGPVDDKGEIVMKGVIKVMSRSSNYQSVHVKVMGFEAIYNLDSGVSAPSSLPCHGNSTDCSTPDNNCNTNDPDPCASVTNEVTVQNSVSGHFNFTRRTCLTPVVDNISPNEVSLHEFVYLTGRGFSTNTCKNEVKIGGSTCTVVQSTSTTIKCIMDLTHSPDINVRHPVSLRVHNKGNTFISITDYTQNTVIFKPYFGSFTPMIGSIAGGTYITINGGGFPTGSNALTVSTNGQSCAIRNVSYTEIVCETVAMSESSGPLAVSLIINGFPSPINCTAVNCDYTFNDSVTTVINTITPKTISGLNNNINISGDFNLVTQQNSEITIGNNLCTISSLSTSMITCSINNLTTGSHDLKLRISPHGLANDTVPNTITVTGSIATVTPNVGSVNGRTRVIISGSVFDPTSTSVQMGSGNTCTLDSVTFDTIVCVTSAGSVGQVNVMVATNGGWIVGSNMYSYSSAVTPVITAVTPNTVSAAGILTITGTGFSTTQLHNVITIGENKCITRASPTANQIQCDYDVMAANVYQVHLLVEGVGKATANGIQFTYQPSVTTISPNAGSFGGGQLVTLRGSGFDPTPNNTNVMICNFVCHIHNISVDEIQCHTPSNAGSGSVSCDISVTINGYSSTLSSSFTYEDSKTPVITNVQPRRAGTGGGTKITITGQRFGNTPSALSIKIAGAVCTVVTAETTTTQAVCITGPIKITTRAKVALQVSDYGIASQEQADFEYIDVWSSVWTWGGGPLPIAGDIVVIKTGQTVLLDTDTPILKILLIQGGSLIFDRKDIVLNAEYILVTNGGVFQVGTEPDPFLNRAIIKLHGHLRSKELPVYGAKMLAVREGTLDLHGRPTPVTWTHLAQTAEVGDTQIVLKHSVNWMPGDLVIIATTGDRHSQQENELRQVTAVSGDGHTLTLNGSLTYKHISVEETLGGMQVELRGEVGLLSHSITIMGSNDAHWHDKIPACEAGFDTGEFVTQTCFQGRHGSETDDSGFGGMIILHTPALNMGTLTARIEYVELNFVGQEFRMGRYPIHFHLLGDMAGSYVRGCGIHKSFNRAVNIHGTHNVMVEHNVIYDIQGGAYFLEDGVETGNTFQYNLAVFVKSSTSLLNDDITPACFWVTNPNNTIRHNAAAGGTHFGFWYRMHTHPDGPSFDPNICPQHVPLKEFYNNTAHSFGWFGLWIFQDYFPKADGGCKTTATVPAVYQNLKAWNCEKGAEWVDIANVQFDGFIMINNEKAGIEMKMAKSKNKFQLDGDVVSNAIIIGHTNISNSNECTKKGVILPFDSGLTVENITFINFDRSCSMLAVTSIDGKCTHRCGGFNYYIKGVKKYNSPNTVFWRWEHEAAIHDLDGTLTGRAPNTKLVPTSLIYPPSVCTSDSSSSGFPGSICDPTIWFTRFAFNKPEPRSLRYKDALFTNEFGNSSVPWLFKRLTHKEGWMVMLPTKYEFKIEFENVDQVTNISYTGMYYELQVQKQDYIIVTTNVSTQPDITQIKSGVKRAAKTTELTYSNAMDGDWFYKNDSLSYIISDKVSSSRRKRSINGLMNSAVAVQVQKCYYTDCIVPSASNNEAPLSRRPDNFMLWSDPNTWTTMGATKPVDGEEVTIEQGYWVVADEALPRITTLNILGTLEFEYMNKTSTEYYDFDLEADYIFIKGGSFIIGWPDEPYRGQTKITLHGSHSTPYFMYTPDTQAPPMGSKVIGVFGGLDLHGVPYNITWTSLATTASKGANQITLEDAVDWEVGVKVVITTTSYSAWQTETFEVTGISPDSKTLTLNGNLQYRHLGETYNIPGVNASFTRSTYKVAAQVGVLSRNIKIMGATYPAMMSELFGARVLVGILSDDVSTYKGYARLSSVEFYHTGQEGFTAFYDPRYSVAFLDLGDVDENRPSMVSKCSFHHGFATAIGVYGTNMLVVENNVIHHTINDAVSVWGNANILDGNLIALVIFPGSYNGREESTNFDFPAGVEAKKSIGLTLMNNVVAGAERIGYSVPGAFCHNLTQYTNNQAQGVLTGVVIFPDYALKESCLLLSGFTIHKGFDFGIYVQADPNLMIRDTLLVDNGVGIYPMLLRPAAVTHIKEDKLADISDSYIIGTSPHFDCTIDVMSNRDKNFAFSGQARSMRTPTGGKIGMSYPVMQSGGNEAPRKTWINIMAYPTIAGLMTVKDVHLSNFKVNQCNRRDVVISPSPGNGDGSHPVTMEKITMGNVDENSKAFIPRPSVGLINPSDCVDMDCEGKKKCLLKDLDGSFLSNGSGAIVPQSEFQWNGDPRRGLGDYRIPKTMLTTTDGSRIPVQTIAPHKGIIRNSECIYRTIWQAYECHNLDYLMMIIESMDKDTEDRRLSPVALLGDGYIDLINGPQDHGWCDGYTCQQRISTFMTLVATGKNYDLYFSSTNPQKTRFYLLNSVSTQAIRLAVFYTNPQRLDVYLNGNYIMPTNMVMNGNGDLVFKNPNYNQQYLPTVNSSSGENYYDRDTNLQYITVRGPDPVDIVISPVIVISFNVPSITIDEFFGDNLVNNLAIFLGVDSSRVKVVNIVSEGSVGRKKRSAPTNTSSVVVHVSEPPVQSISNGTDSQLEAVRSNLTQYSEKIVTSTQLGNLANELNITLLNVAVQEPLPSPSDPAWKFVAESLTNGTQPLQEVKVPSVLKSLTTVESGVEGAGFNVIPELIVLDSGGSDVKLLGSTVAPWEVTARIKAGTGANPNASILGNTTQPFKSGLANFQGLALSDSGSGYEIEFVVTKPPQANFLLKTMGPFTIKTRVLGAKTVDMVTDIVRGENTNVTLEIIDMSTNAKARDIFWKGHSWNCTVGVYGKSGYHGSVNLTTPDMEISLDGMATFSDLSLDQYGKVCLRFECVTSPVSQYSFVAHSGLLDVQKKANERPVIEEIKTIQIKLNANYSVISGEEDVFQAYISNTLASKHNNVEFNNCTTQTGSIIVTIMASGRQADVQTAIDALWAELQTDMTFTFGNITMIAFSYMAVDGVERQDGDSQNSSGSLHPALIALIAVVIAAVIGSAIVVLIIYKTKSGRSMMCKTKSNSKGHEYNEDNTVVTGSVPPSATDLYARMGSSYSTHSSPARRRSAGTVRTVNPFSPIFLNSANSSPGSDAPLLFSRSNSSQGSSTPDTPGGSQTPRILRIDNGSNGGYYERELSGKNLVVSSPVPQINCEREYTKCNSPFGGMPEPDR